MTERAGVNLSNRTGSYVPYQAIFGQGQNVRFNEITVEKFLDEKQVALKVGFYPMGNDFAVLPYLCNFMNDELCGHPITLFGNSGWADGPAGRWTGRIKYHITNELQIQAAAVDSNPLYTMRQDGFKLNFTGNTGVIAPVEFKYQLGKNPSDYGGTYNLGGYYDSSARPNLANPKTFTEGLFGFYFEAAQQIIKWGPENTDGLALFGVFTVSDQNTAKFKNAYDAGFAARGVVPDRPLDILSFGWAGIYINPRFQFRLAEAGSRSRPANRSSSSTTPSSLSPHCFFARASNTTSAPVGHRLIRTPGSSASTSSSLCDGSGSRWPTGGRCSVRGPEALAMRGLPGAARRPGGILRSPHFRAENSVSDKRTKTNSDRIHRLDEQDRSSPVTLHGGMVKRVAGTACPRFLMALALAFGVIASATAPPLSIAAGEAPAEFIQTLGNDLVAEMRSAASLDQKEAYFRQLLRQDFDMDGMSRLVLGPYWRTASLGQQQEFRALLEKHIMLSHGRRLTEASGGDFRVTGSRTDPNGVVVVTGELITPLSARNEVDVQLGMVDGFYRIQDVAFDNVSMVLSYRSEIQSVPSHGEQLEALLTAMREEH
jgi:ABC-type transporter MlaC component